MVMVLTWWAAIADWATLALGIGGLGLFVTCFIPLLMAFDSDLGVPKICRALLEAGTLLGAVMVACGIFLPNERATEDMLRLAYPEQYYKLEASRRCSHLTWTERRDLPECIYLDGDKLKRKP